MNSNSENDIIQRVLGGDVDAFEEIVRSYEKAVYNLALRMVGNRDDALDMAQEAFIKVYGSLASFRGESKFSSWLYRITTNVCLDFLRAKSRKPQVPLDGGDGEDESALTIPDMRDMPEQVLMKKLDMQALHTGLEKLPVHHRQVLVMRELGGMSYADIARELSIEEGTVKSRIFRARKSLCAFLLSDGNISDFSPSEKMKGGGKSGS